MKNTDIETRTSIDDPLSGEKNMQIDAEMLSQAVHGIASIRTYQWAEPTISLGHFQSKTLENVPQRFIDLPLVNRLSGGGAILHDHELTYSIAIPSLHPMTQNPSQLYNIIHECIIRLLRNLGVASNLRGDDAFAEKPFLCFGRGDERDIVIGNHKIVGSAQRRRQGAVLQHGSLLLKKSSFAPEFPGIEELTSVNIPYYQFAFDLLNSISESLNLKVTNE